MDVFPAAFPLQGLRIAVAGEGEAAEAKARLFVGSPAILIRVAAADALAPQSYAGVRLAFLALPGVSAIEAAAAARGAGALVNVVDRPELCDFNTPALVDRGAVVGAIATGGAAPLLAAELRRALEASWPTGLGAAARLLQALQGEVRAAYPAVAERRAWLRRLLDSKAPDLAIRGEMGAALALARVSLGVGGRIGRLSVLAPPAAPDLISLRALQALGRADRIVVAAGVDPALVAMARRDAPVDALDEVSVDAIRAELAQGGSVVCIGQPAEFAAFGQAHLLSASA